MLHPQYPEARSNMASLLRLARHPNIPLKSLEWADPRCLQSLPTIPEVTLKSYIYLNVIAGLPSERWRSLQLDPYSLRVVHAVRGFSNTNANHLLHWEFWRDAFIYDNNLSAMNGRGDRWWRYQGHIDWFADVAKLKVYLSLCLETLVRYDCFTGEAGMDINWVDCIMEQTCLPFHKEIDSGTESDRHVYRAYITDDKP